MTDGRGFADLNPVLATAVRSDNMNKDLPSPEILHKLLRYDPDTGFLFWLPRGLEFFKDAKSWKIWNTRFAGVRAFNSVATHGYTSGRIFRKQHRAHRVIWAMQTGDWPKNEIDHVDGNKINNVFSNLREATRSQNCANTKSRKNSTSKFLGVSWCNTYKKWSVRIRDNGRAKNLGYFHCENQAAMAYDTAAKKIHAEFANLNFP